MAYGEAREEKWKGKRRMEWVASTHALYRNTVDPALLPLMRTPRLPAADWTVHPHRYKWTRPFRWKTKSGFCACVITFRFHSNTRQSENVRWETLSKQSASLVGQLTPPAVRETASVQYISVRWAASVVDLGQLAVLPAVPLAAEPVTSSCTARYNAVIYSCMSQ